MTAKKFGRDLAMHKYFYHTLRTNTILHLKVKFTS